MSILLKLYIICTCRPIEFNSTTFDSASARLFTLTPSRPHHSLTHHSTLSSHLSCVIPGHLHGHSCYVPFNPLSNSHSHYRYSYPVSLLALFPTLLRVFDAQCSSQ